MATAAEQLPASKTTAKLTNSFNLFMSRELCTGLAAKPNILIFDSTFSELRKVLRPDGLRNVSEWLQWQALKAFNCSRSREFIAELPKTSCGMKWPQAAIRMTTTAASLSPSDIHRSQFHLSPLRKRMLPEISFRWLAAQHCDVTSPRRNAVWGA
ncbi:MAG TPA: hypothetical protein VJT54_17950 [Verrucomicrobiae bacterium]|nr:hypothetical protein [Verrucomicrobiae bacterium]